MWLTTYAGELTPNEISADFTFVQAPTDDPYQRVITHQDTTPGEWLGLLITVSVPLVAGVVLIVVVIVSTRRRRRARTAAAKG